ncbi:MAG: phospho-N-acetylmuramoyl-pentapeptide-transferase, partial [Alphaproteobacteria bacterium]|nr:phospho-N-acetylmuramoyl-pentapeptide-transferase [Alphaproteobacteria bacterium]
MLHYVFSLCGDGCLFTNLFRYLTFRTGGAILTAMLISFLCGRRFIAWLKSKQGEGQPIRHDGPEGHLVTKKGTPTMGGGLMLISITIATLLWGDLKNAYVWIVLIVTLGFGCIGAYDDYLKLTKRSCDGLSGKKKLFFQGVMMIIATYCTVHQFEPHIATQLTFPFMKEWMIDLGVFFYVWSFFVVVGASNAVNLTDGLDGLAIVPVMITA